MLPLEPPDSWHLSGALGWLELGDASEAEAELEHIGPARQQHPDVLEVRWLICADQEEWAEGLQAARSLIHAAPERCAGWLHQAYALRRVPGGSLQQAWDALLPAYKNYPREPIVAYNLSCYAAQLGQLNAARVWLKRAFRSGDREKLSAMALADSDLQPLWVEIQRW